VSESQVSSLIWPCDSVIATLGLFNSFMSVIQLLSDSNHLANADEDLGSDKELR